MRAKTWLAAFGLIGLVGVTSGRTATAVAQDYPGGDYDGYDEGSILGPPDGYPAGDAKELGPPSGGYPAGEGKIPKPSTGGYPAGQGSIPGASTGGYPAGEGRIPGATNRGPDGRAQLGEDDDEE